MCADVPLCWWANMRSELAAKMREKQLWVAPFAPVCVREELYLLFQHSGFGSGPTNIKEKLHEQKCKKKVWSPEHTLMDSLLWFVSLPDDQTHSEVDSLSQALSHSEVFFFLLLENWTSNECFLWNTSFILELKCMMMTNDKQMQH